MLTGFLLLPLAGSIMTLFVPEHRKTEARWIALFFSTLAFILALVIYVAYDSTAGGMQFVDSTNWVQTDVVTLGFGLGVDGLSAPMILLLGLLGVVSVLVSWIIYEKAGQYLAWLHFQERAKSGLIL